MKTGNKHQAPSRFTKSEQGMIRADKGKFVLFEEYMLLFNAYQYQIQKSKRAGKRITAMQEIKAIGMLDKAGKCDPPETVYPLPYFTPSPLKEFPDIKQMETI